MLADLDKLDKWNDHVKELQRGWIGRSYGANITFNLKIQSNSTEVPLTIYTTRPDTIFGVSFVAIAHDSPKVKELLQADPDNWIDQNAYERYLEQVRLQQGALNKEFSLEDIDQGL
jgi:leucyl-tRNA synthetase